MALCTTATPTWVPDPSFHTQNFPINQQQDKVGSDEKRNDKKESDKEEGGSSAPKAEPDVVHDIFRTPLEYKPGARPKRGQEEILR